MGDRVYLNLSYVQQYTDIDAYIYKDPYRVAIQYQFDKIKTVKAEKNIAVRYRGGIKSSILTEVKKGTELRLLEELEDWDQVATDDGYIGYVEKKKVGKVEETIFERNFQGEEYTYITMDDPVNMVWHQVTSTECQCISGRCHCKYDRGECDLTNLVLSDRYSRKYFQYCKCRLCCQST